MRALLAILAVVALAGAGCRGDGDTPADEAAVRLQEIATSADTLTYKASYLYEQRGSARTGVETKLEIVQRPPESLRKIQTTTAGPNDETYTETSWLISKLPDGPSEGAEPEFFTCFAGDFTTKGEVRCVEVAPPGMFNRRDVNEIFEFVREPAKSFSRVEAVDGEEIAGEDATCFQAMHEAKMPPIPSPAAGASPALFNPSVFRFHLCYSSDGVLLRAIRRIAEPVPSGQGTNEAVLEATSVSRSVRPSEIRLPGELFRAGVKGASATAGPAS